ncbi:MAG: hypothetical protein JW782_01285 [Candidatus Saganbacteria bacterium]|nr:hypothetical protein [Candidatus Saganbacteria bacterium]
MMIILLGLSLLFPLLLGYCIVALVLRNRTISPALERFAWAFGLGTAFLTMVMFILVLLKVPLTLANIILPCLVLLCPALFLIIKKRYPLFGLFSLSATFRSVLIADKEQGRLVYWSERTLLLAVILKIGYVFFEALIKPVVAWDAWTSWAFKARIFFIDKVPLVSYFERYPIGIKDYPLHIPFLETWIYNCLGVWNDQVVKIIFPLYFVCLLLILYYGLRRLLPRLNSLIFTFVLSALPFLTYHATISYADFPLAFYYLAGLMLLYLFMASKDKSFLLLSMLYLGCLPWVKKEGMLLLAVVLFVYLLYLFFEKDGASFKDKLLSDLKYLVVPLLLSAPWALFKTAMGIGANRDQRPYLPAFSVLAERLVNLLRISGEKMFFSGNWNILWALFFLVGAIYFWRIISSKAKYLFLTVLLNLAALAAIYLFTDSYKYLLDGTTLNRNMLTFIPSLVLCLAVGVPAALFGTERS